MTSLQLSTVEISNFIKQQFPINFSELQHQTEKCVKFST